MEMEPRLSQKYVDLPALGRGGLSWFHPSSPPYGSALFALLTGRTPWLATGLRTKEAVRRQAHRWFPPVPCRGPRTIAHSLPAVRSRLLVRVRAVVIRLTRY